MAWEAFLSSFEVVLWNIALALLISGGLLVILSFVLNIENISEAFHLGDHGADVDHDISFDKDIDMGHDISHDVSADVDHDISFDKDIDVGHEVDISHDFEIDAHDISADIDGDGVIDSTAGDSADIASHSAKDKMMHGVKDLTDITRSSAPLFLLMSTYFLIFGILGVTTLNIQSDSIVTRIMRIVIVIVIPYFFAYFLSKVWRRISATTSIPVPKGEQLVGEIAEVYVTVDNRGGLVVVNLGKDHGFAKLHAKSFSPFDTFERGETVRIVGFKNRTYLIDKV